MTINCPRSTWSAVTPTAKQYGNDPRACLSDAGHADDPPCALPTASVPRGAVARLWAAYPHGSRRGTAERGVRPPPARVAGIRRRLARDSSALGAAGYRAVAVDQRGYAANARPRDTASYAAGHLQSDALAFADQLGAERFHLIAHDWGGLVAWGLASAHPRRVSSLSVLATPHPQALQAALADEEQQRRLDYVRFFRQPGAPNNACSQTGRQRCGRYTPDAFRLRSSMKTCGGSASRAR